MDFDTVQRIVRVVGIALGIGLVCVGVIVTAYDISRLAERIKRLEKILDEHGIYYEG